MKKIEKYVFGSFLTSFFLAFLVLSFVLTIGLMVQIVGFILDGVSLSLVGSFAAVSFPETMQWTIPLALLFSGVLVFSRLSADSEIAAMRACGVDLYSVMRWPVLFALALTLVGAWVNNEVVPRGHEVRRSLKTKVSVSTGLDLLEPGIWIDDLPKVKLYFRSKNGNWIDDLVVMDYSSSKFVRSIRASRACVTSEGRDLILDLYNVKVDPIAENRPGMTSMQRYVHRMKDVLAETKYEKKMKDFDFPELLEAISKSKAQEKTALAKLRALKDDELDEAAKADFDRDHEAKAIKKSIRQQRSKMKTELSKRFVFAAASFCFVLVGIPLGIRSHRRESTIGIAISLVISVVYYLFVMLFISLQKKYSIHPEFLIWLPVVLCGALSWRLVSRNR